MDKYVDKKTTYLNIKISWKIRGEHRHPSNYVKPPRGKGGYRRGGIGGPPSRG